MNCRAVSVGVGTRLCLHGNLGQAAAQLLQDAAVRARLDRVALRAQLAQLLFQNPKFQNPTRDMPDVFVEHGDPAKLLALCGLDAAGIEQAILKRFGAKPALVRAAVNS